MLEETLEISRARERTLTTDLQNEKNLLKSAAANYNDFEKGVKIWTERLVDVAQRLDAELSTMGLPNFSYSSDERVSTSARLTIFLKAWLMHSSCSAPIEQPIWQMNPASSAGPSSPRC